MSTSDPLIGKRLGDYLIEGILGTGGMARVYRGYDDNLDRYAAIKVIEPQLIASAEEDEYRERFLKEARAIARLNHPAIVGVYQFNQVGNLYYIAMEYVDGQNLRDELKNYLRQDKLMPTTNMLTILYDIADGLDYAHGQNIIHRDVKPSNIIVKGNGKAVLTDFGLALNAMEGTIGNTFGSVHYIAPEQAISSAQAVPQSDQYSLGIVAYELLTGRVPFDDASAMSVALKHISDPPPPPTDLNPNIPPEVEQVLLKALDKEVDERYSKARDFINALEVAFSMSDESEIAPPPNIPADLDEPSGAIEQPAIYIDDDAETTQAEAVDESASQAQPAPANATQSMMTATQTMTLPQQGFSFGVLLGVIVVLLFALTGVTLFFTGALDGVLGYTSATETAVAAAQIQATDAEATRVQARTIQETQTQSALVALQNTESAATERALDSTENAMATQTQIALMATDTPTPTDEPTASNTPTDEPSTTPTESMSPTPTDESTNTPTRTPSHTPTDEPTHTPTATHTATITPTATNTPPPTSTPTPSLLLPPDNDGVDARQVLLRYNGRTIVIGNRDTVTLDVSDLQFVLFEPDDNGEIQQTTQYILLDASFGSRNNRFLLSRLLATRCFQLLDTRQFSEQPTNNPLADDLCSSRPFWTTTPKTFWINPSEEAYFEVRLGPVDVIATCPTVPRFSRIEERRCAVDVNILD